MKEIIELIELSNRLHEKHRLRIERLEMCYLRSLIVEVLILLILVGWLIVMMVK